jgi:hypothetical protein
MNGKFFDKCKIDSDRVSEIVSDLDDLISSVETFRDELDTYKDELESQKSDLEDAETKQCLDAVVRGLKDISVPDGCENMDTTPGIIADACDECEVNGSEYDKWQEEVQQRITRSSEALEQIGRGAVLPSQKGHPFSIARDHTLPARIVRPGQAPDAQTNLPYSAEVDAWAKAINGMADAASRVHYGAEAEFTRDGYSKSIVEDLLKVVTSMMAFKHATGAVICPTDQPHLALSWFVDDLLHAVAKNLGYATKRLVVTNIVQVTHAADTLRALREEFAEGCGQIDESVNANS